MIVESQACLIGNRRLLQNNPELLDSIRKFIEFIDAALQGRQYYQVTSNIRGDDAETLAQRIVSNPITRGLQGPTLAPIYATNGSRNERWHTLTIIVEGQKLLPAVEHLRSIGGTQTSAVPIRYVFLEESTTFSRLREVLKR